MSGRQDNGESAANLSLSVRDEAEERRLIGEELDREVREEMLTACPEPGPFAAGTSVLSDPTIGDSNQ